MQVQKITPFLWFDGQAEEAANYYTSVFPNSKVTKVVRNGPAGTGPVGSVLIVDFELDGLKFVALNGGPQFKFNESVSFVVNCETQDEVDHYWQSLSAGGTEIQCGWLKDKFGLAWQITPALLLKLIGSPDPVKSQRAMKAMMGMKKIDIRQIQEAYDNG